MRPIVKFVVFSLRFVVAGCKQLPTATSLNPFVVAQKYDRKGKKKAALKAALENFMIA
jgi:hypothetical protein